MAESRHRNRTTADEYQLAEDLRAVIGRLVRAARRVDTLPTAEAAVLGELDRSGLQSTAQLAARRRVRHQSMATTVHRLHNAGLLAKQPHPTDRRTSLLSITPAGVSALHTERTRRTDWLAIAIRDELEASQRQLLADSIGLLGALADHG